MSDTNPKELFLASLAPIEQVWPVKVHVVNAGLAAIFSRGKLHSFACVGRSEEGKPIVSVPVTSWANVRLVSDRCKVPSSVYIETTKGLYYHSWPPHAGLDYSAQPDDVFGCVIQIPKRDFKLVEAVKK